MTKKRKSNITNTTSDNFIVEEKEEQIMKPTMGRIVFFHGFIEECPGVITKVINDTTVNITIFPDGHMPVFMVHAIQDEEMKNERGWRWPPRDSTLDTTLKQEKGE